MKNITTDGGVKNFETPTLFGAIRLGHRTGSSSEISI